MSEELKAVVAEVRLLAAVIGAPVETRRNRKDEERWSAQLSEIATCIEAATAPMSGLSGEEREALERMEAEPRGSSPYARDTATVLAALRRLATAPADSLGVDDAMVERAARALCSNAGMDPDAITTVYENGVDESWPAWHDWKGDAWAALTAALGERHESE